jgi:hypothetical protein
MPFRILVSSWDSNKYLLNVYQIYYVMPTHSVAFMGLILQISKLPNFIKEIFRISCFFLVNVTYHTLNILYSVTNNL